MKDMLRGLGMGALALSLAIAGSNPAFAGFIFAGTDSDDHGFVSGGANQDGWLFMQRAIENLGAGVTNGNKVVTILGSSSTALTAATSAFNHSSLVGAGWTLQTVTTGNLATFFGSGINNSGILMMDSGTNVSGGVDGSVFVPYAATINTFLGGGGGLLSQGNGYDWVTALGLGLTVTDVGGGGISSAVTLTAAGNAAFPGLTNADLSTGPWHNYFTNTGLLPVLGTAPQGATTRALILGSAAGSVTNPTTPAVPEPATLLLLGTGLAALAGFRRLKKA